MNDEGYGPSKGAGKRFDYGYYKNVHIPLAIRLLGPAVRSVTVERGLEPGAPWPGPAFFVITGFTCETIEAYTQALVPHRSGCRTMSRTSPTLKRSFRSVTSWRFRTAHSKTGTPGVTLR